MAAENVLTRKVGPLPGWAWGAIGIGVYVVYRLRKNSQTASSAAATSAGGVAPSGYATAGGYGQPEPTASLSTPGGFSYSGPASGLSNPTVAGLFSPTPAAAIPAGATPAGNTNVASNYLPVTQQAALADIGQGIPVYESGTSALQFATQHGGSVAGLDPNAYYVQNPTAQQINLASSLGYPLYVKGS